MADVLRTVTLTPGGRPVTRLNLEDATGATWFKDRDSFKVVPPAKTVGWARSVRRFAGSVQSGESQDNWTIIGSWWIKGASQTEVLNNIERLMAEIDDPHGLTPYQPRLMEWRPDGATNSTLFELRGAGLYVPTYKWTEFRQGPMMKVDLSWPIAPLALGLPLDIYDPFTEDSRGDYTVDKGGLSWTAGTNALAFTGGANSEQQGRHTVRGYTYDDAETTVQYFIPEGAANGPEYVSAQVCCTEATTYIEVRWTSTEKLEILKKVAGVGPTQLANLATTGKKPTPGQVIWIRARIEGNYIVGEVFLNGPGPNATALYTVTFAMTATESAVFGEGHRGTGGYHLKLQSDTSTVMESFQCLPYVYKSRPQPDVRWLRSVPGTAPAKMDVMMTTGVLASPATWSCIGWTRKPAQWNFVQNGHFTSGLEDWVYAAGKPPVATPHLPGLDASYGVIPTEITQTGSGFPKVTPQFPTGPPFISIKINAAGGEASNQVPLSTRFKKGTPYSFAVKVVLEGAGAVAKVWLGKRGDNTDSAKAEDSTVSATAAVLTGTWIPKADTDTAVFAVNVKPGAGAAATLKVAQAEVWEGNLVGGGSPFAFAEGPLTQLGGRGALPPFGVIQGEESNVVNASNVQFSTGLQFNSGSAAVTATAESYEGSGLMYATNEGGVLNTGTTGGLNGGGSAQLAWWIDPSLMLDPDDFARGAISIEAYWRGLCSGSAPGASSVTAPRLLLWALPEPVQTGEGYRYTNEYQSAGHSLAQLPAVTGNYNGLRPARLGTLELPVDPNTPVRWLLVLDMIWSAATVGLFATDSLLLVPSTRRALLPTGKSRTDGYYPTFAPLSATVEAQKIVKSDLRGQDRVVGIGGLSNPNAGSGMSGAPMDELPVNSAGGGLTDLAVVTALSTLVPDDPSGEQGDLLQPNATTHFAIQPRFRLARGS